MLEALNYFGTAQSHWELNTSPVCLQYELKSMWWQCWIATISANKAQVLVNWRLPQLKMN